MICAWGIKLMYIACICCVVCGLKMGKFTTGIHLHTLCCDVLVGNSLSQPSEPPWGHWSPYTNLMWWLDALKVPLRMMGGGKVGVRLTLIIIVGYLSFQTLTHTHKYIHTHTPSVQVKKTHSDVTQP